MVDEVGLLAGKNFHLNNSFCFWINRLNNSLQESFNKQLSAYDVTWPQWLVVNVLCHEGASTPAKIAEEIGVDRSAVTRLLDRLEAKQFIVREHDKQDRRSLIILLSEQGMSLIEDINQNAYKHQQQAMSELHSSERRALKGELQKMLASQGVDSKGRWLRAD